MDKIRILVADDERVSRELLKSLLTKWGYQVITATNGDHAWQLLQKHSELRLVILDWMMPGRDGIEICRLIRQKHAESGYTYTIILTAKDNKEDALAGLEAGADDYITKPFHPKELRFRLKIGERILELENKLTDAYEEMKRLATFDALTELWNRRVILEQMEKELLRLSRENRALSVVLADIDHFKQFNDNYGHALGDKVLIHVGRVLRETIRPYDGIGRYGGEEFLFYFPDCDEQQGFQIAERLRQQLQNHPLQVRAKEFRISASFGGTTFYPTGTSGDVNQLLKVADSALYQAKKTGRNRVVWLPSETAVPRGKAV